MEVKNINQGIQQFLDQNISSSDRSTQELQTNIDSKSNNSDNQKPITEKDVKKAADKLNKLLEDRTTHAEYEIYGKSKDLIIRIVDDKTKEVIKEIPPKKFIDMIDKLCELAGIFIDQKA